MDKSSEGDKDWQRAGVTVKKKGPAHVIRFAVSVSRNSKRFTTGSCYVIWLIRMTKRYSDVDAMTLSDYIAQNFALLHKMH